MAKKSQKKPRLSKTAAEVVAKRVNLVEILLLSNQAVTNKLQRASPPAEFGTTVRVDATSETIKDPDGRAIQMVSIQVNFFLQAKSEVESKEPNLSLQCEYVALYNASGDKGFTESQLVSYAKQYALHDLWPYFSEYVHMTTVRMGMPPLRMPLFNRLNLEAD